MKISDLPVVNAKRSVLLTISSADVKAGKLKNPSECAAALACKRQLHVSEARVHLGRIYLKNGKRWLRYHTPEALRTEIVAFDSGGNFSPGEYLLGKMQPTRRTDKRQGGKSTPPKPKRRHRMKPHYVSGVRASIR